MNAHRPAGRSGRLYVIGAGMAGLAAAVQGVRQGRAVTVMEATGHGGGRCRSFADATLGRVIDNGSHLILSGNRNIFTFLERIGAPDGIRPMGGGGFPFLDLASRRVWCLHPTGGRIPWWLLSAKRRVPDSSLGDYLALWRLARAGPEASLADCLDPARAIFERLWAPLSLAILNCEPETASAALSGGCWTKPCSREAGPAAPNGRRKDFPRRWSIRLSTFSAARGPRCFSPTA